MTPLEEEELTRRALEEARRENRAEQLAAKAISPAAKRAIEELQKDAPPGEGPFLRNVEHLVTKREAQPSERQEHGLAAITTNPVGMKAITGKVIVQPDRNLRDTDVDVPAPALDHDPRDDVNMTGFVPREPLEPEPELPKAAPKRDETYVTSPSVAKLKELGVPRELEPDGRALGGTLRLKKQSDLGSRDTLRLPMVARARWAWVAIALLGVAIVLLWRVSVAQSTGDADSSKQRRSAELSGAAVPPAGTTQLSEGTSSSPPRTRSSGSTDAASATSTATAVVVRAPAVSTEVAATSTADAREGSRQRKSAPPEARETGPRPTAPEPTTQSAVPLPLPPVSTTVPPSSSKPARLQD